MSRLSPILQAGGGRETLQQTRNLLFPSPPPPPLPLRNQAGPGLKRTEPHSALNIDKTPWKKWTANYRPDLRRYFSHSWCELDFWNTVKQMSRFITGRQTSGFLIHYILKKSGDRWNNLNFTHFLSLVDWCVLWSSNLCGLEMLSILLFKFIAVHLRWKPENAHLRARWTK